MLFFLTKKHVLNLYNMYSVCVHVNNKLGKVLTLNINAANRQYTVNSLTNNGTKLLKGISSFKKQQINFSLFL